MEESNKLEVSQTEDRESRTEENGTFKLGKPFLCDFCGKRFRTKQEKKKHLLVHTGEKPFECELCFKKFTLKGQLQNHYKVHVKQSLFKDKNVSSSPERQLFLTQNEKIVNQLLTERVYACEFCEKKFPNATYLSVHLRVHTQEKPFECSLCHKRFSQEGNLKTHLLVHTNQKPFECNVCQKKFRQKGNLQTHYKKIHTKEKQFKCQVPAQEFKQKGNLLLHEKLHQVTETPYECDFCLKLYKNKASFVKHLQMHNCCESKLYEGNSVKKKYQISKTEICGWENVLQSNLTILRKEECPRKDKIADMAKYVCVVCGESFDKYRSLNLHYSVHLAAKSEELFTTQSSSVKGYEEANGKVTSKTNLPKISESCMEMNELENGRSFQDSNKSDPIYSCIEEFPVFEESTSNTDDSSIDGIDYAIDTRDMSFICGKCGKRFSGKPSFLIHYKIHSGMQLYECGVCNKKFNQSQSLKHHLKVHSGEKPFKCDICTKTFRQKANLMVHLRVHTAEKPYQCEICSKCFRLKSSLNVHSCNDHSNKKQPLVLEKSQLKILSIEKPFKCDFCTKTFEQKGNLKVHLRVHTGEKPYKCENCSKCFRHKSSLIVHSCNVHNHEKQHLVLEELQNLKIHSVEKPFKCNFCIKTFKQKAHLKVHLRVHTGEKPYQCEICSKCFSQKNSLNLHSYIVHSNKKHLVLESQ